jgi:hypothetical protein
MNDRDRLARLTTFLYGLAAAMFAGTIVELLAAKHYQEPMQLIPFALCGVGIAAVLLAWQRPTRATVQGLRLLMLVTAAATLLGVWKHLEGNIGFIREMHPATSGWPLLAGALTGRAPFLASGVLAAAATTAIAATFAAGWSLRGPRRAPDPIGEWRVPSPSRPS